MHANPHHKLHTPRYCIILCAMHVWKRMAAQNVTVPPATCVHELTLTCLSVLLTSGENYLGDLSLQTASIISSLYVGNKFK